MKTQTSVDWLAEQLHDNAIKALVKREIDLNQFQKNRDEILQTARQMHREEVEEAVDDWMVNGNRKGKDYYTQTFETP